MRVFGMMYQKEPQKTRVERMGMRDRRQGSGVRLAQSVDVCVVVMDAQRAC